MPSWYSGREMAAPSGKFWMPMPRARARAPAAPSPAAARAKARPTAMPSTGPNSMAASMMGSEAKLNLK